MLQWPLFRPGYIYPSGGGGGGTPVQEEKSLAGEARGPAPQHTTQAFANPISWLHDPWYHGTNIVNQCN